LRRSDTPTVAEALTRYLGNRGFARRVKEAGVVHDWADLVGPKIAAVTTPLSVDTKGTLWVRVSSPAWRQELQLMSRDILRELAKRGRRITAIRWTGAGSDPTHRPSHPN
jgi:predicted nucleic acid-binding Zn ribbon protein